MPMKKIYKNIKTYLYIDNKKENKQEIFVC